MIRASRLLVLLLAFAAFAVATFAAPAPARAQDGAAPEDVERRREWLKALPPEQRARLHAALERFKALPSAERDRLRRKAAELGADRLDGLAGRDLTRLRSRHGTLEAEIDEVMRNLGDRLAGMSDDEVAYVRWMALRRFQWHVRRRVLRVSSYADVEAMPAEDRRKRTREAIRELVADRIDRLPDEERNRILALPESGRAAEAERLFAEFRMEQTVEFAQIFGRYAVTEFAEKPPERRRAEVERWKDRERWFQASRVLREEFGLAADVRRQLAGLGPSDWARLQSEVRDTESLPLQERRAKLTELVRKLYGQRALEPPRRDARVQPLLHEWRERRLASPRRHGRGGAADETAPATGTTAPAGAR